MKIQKCDRRLLLETAVFVTLLYGIAACVYLNGDDFMYGAFAHTGLLANVTDYYFTGNGRFWINVLDSALLWFDRYAFILVLPWIVLAFVVLMAKVIQRLMAGQPDREKEKSLIRMGMVLFACLDVMCMRETVFWITGMMNYLFPAVIFLLGYLLFLKSRNGELGRWGRVLCYAVCLLASSSVEQFALMFVGMMTLHHGWDLIRKKHIPACAWFSYALSLLGLAALLLAPGNYVRVDTQGKILPPFIDNAWTLLYQNTTSKVSVPYLLMLAMAVTQREGNLGDRRMILTLLVLVGCLISPVLDKAIFDVVLIGLLAWQIVTTLIRERFAPGVWFMIFVGLGSQGMLLISAIWGFRCMFSMYMVYMILIGCVLYHAQDAQCRNILLAGLLMAIHPAPALVFCLLLLVEKEVWRDPLKKAAPAGIRCLVVLALVGMLMGYARNVPTHRQNLLRTAQVDNNSIVIEELPDDIYSWYFVPIGEFHEEYYRILHEIPDSVEIIYEELSE